MSATSLPAAGARVRSRSAVAGHVLVVAAGTSLLLIRTQVAAMPDARRVGILALVYGAMLAAALAVPVEPDRARARPAAVLVAGLAAVGLAAVVSGRPPAAPFGAWVLPLALLAAVAEEALFRRAAYSFVEPLGAVAAVALTALLFAGIHLPLYGFAALPVDIGAGLLFGWQRYASRTWTVPAQTHAAANLLAVILR